MSAEDRIKVLEKLLVSLLDRTTLLEARIAALERGGSDDFEMSSGESISMFERMFPNAVESKKACSDAATYSGVQ